MANPVHTDIEMSINNLYVTFLPDDLLKLLRQARNAYLQGNILRAKALLNIIKRNCKRRNIYIGNHRIAPAFINYKKRQEYLGQFIDIQI